jgi:hypothetical protein
MPLAVMLEHMRWADEEAARLTERLAGAEPSLETEQLSSRLIRLRQLSVEWAHLAAVYVHPRLAAIAHQHLDEKGRPIVPQIRVHIMQAPPEAPRLTAQGPRDSETVQ